MGDAMPVAASEMAAVFELERAANAWYDAKRGAEGSTPEVLALREVDLLKAVEGTRAAVRRLIAEHPEMVR